MKYKENKFASRTYLIDIHIRRTSKLFNSQCTPENNFEILEKIRRIEKSVLARS